VSVAETPAELLERKAELLRLDSVVDRVDEIASLLPTDVEHKQPVVQRIAQRLANLPQEPPGSQFVQDRLVPMLLQLRTMLAALPESPRRPDSSDRSRNGSARCRPTNTTRGFRATCNERRKSC